MQIRKINKLLVANRGEIAIRIFRAATELRIRTVAIYTYEDRYSLHRYKADEAYQIGKNDQPLKPYLDMDEIINIAKQVGANAIHPGYGFLSENSEFARRCQAANIIFVGPSPQAMDALGDKVSAKAIAYKAQVPIVESNRQIIANEKAALAEAHRIGYPVMIKAVSGGGGRGMRAVYDDVALKKAFLEASREAQTAFGNPEVFIEKYIENPKHIEVQILGDKHGNVVHLFERDCSLQRRFQKVVEIAPAPNMRNSTRSRLYGYALKIADAVKYDNAGTVEFLVDKDENIYFIEVNTRIQVEHTVTEVVTGIDLVRNQILIAQGYALDSDEINVWQRDLKINGFAIQCRITTEDPANDFKPDYGTIIAYRNATGFNIRLDEGSAYAGAIISPFFDSMLTKVTASGRSLQGACLRMYRALIEFRVRGVKTNITFLENVVENTQFQKGDVTVNFIKENPDLLKVGSRRNRATKLLRYLANLSVNGNPDVGKVELKPTFDTPRLPDFDRYANPPKGTKQLLTDLGPEKFSKWLKKQKEIQITDTTFRDAHQSLLATRFRTCDMLAVARAYALEHPQTFSMEVWGGATFDVAMRFLHECPWQRLQKFREAIPNILLQMLLRGSNAVGYTAYPDNLVEEFIEHAAKTGIDVFRIFDSLNWVENMTVSINAVRERTGSLAEACICYTGDLSNPDEKKYTLEYYLNLARHLEDAGAHIIAIKDMAGLLKPYAAEQLVGALSKTIDLPIHLHTHDTSSAQLATYLKAIEKGVDVVDVALSSMSGLTSQPNFNTLVQVLQGTPRCPDFDMASLNEFSDYWETIRTHYNAFESGLKAGTAEVYEHEIPGGQYSNLRPQATSLGLSDKMPEIKKAYAEVNQLFGNIVKVTPSSKVVGDLALYMVANGYSAADILEKGKNIDFPASTRNFFRGELGQPHGGFPKSLQKLVLKNEKPLKTRANAQMEPIDFTAGFEEFKQRFGAKRPFIEFLSYKLYPTVYDNFHTHREVYDEVTVLPTPAFFYGMSHGEEIIIEIEEGKNLLVKLLYIENADEEGNRKVHFNLNGQQRTVKVKDTNAKTEQKTHVKANEDDPKEVGSPLQGLLSKIFVKPGDKVKANQPLFVIEAMKMETTITATEKATVVHIALTEGTLVQADDLVVRLK